MYVLENLLHASQFSFRTRHSTIIPCTRLTDHVILYTMSNAVVFLDIEKAFHTIWHSGLFHKLCNLQFSTIIINVICSSLSFIKFKVSVEGEISTTREMQAQVPKRFRPVFCPVQFM